MAKRRRRRLTVKQIYKLDQWFRDNREEIASSGKGYSRYIQRASLRVGTKLSINQMQNAANRTGVRNRLGAIRAGLNQAGSNGIANEKPLVAKMREIARQEAHLAVAEAIKDLV